MKHYDLKPGEVVTLHCWRPEGSRLLARFLFRDTIHACFEVLGALDPRYEEFAMGADGELLDEFRRVVAIHSQREVNEAARLVSAESMLAQAWHRTHPRGTW